MSDIGIVGLILLIANGLISYYGFKNRVFLEAYKFQVYPILAHRDYKRLVTSGFLHAGWMHLLFNMFVLYSFGSMLELSLIHI